MICVMTITLGRGGLIIIHGKIHIGWRIENAIAFLIGIFG